MKIWFALVKNETRLYFAERGLQFAFVLALALLAMFRFGMPLETEGNALASLEVFPVVAYCIAILQLLLMAVYWESEGFAYRYHAMNRVPLNTLFLAKSSVGFIVQIPLWLFCILGYLIMFPVEIANSGMVVSLLLTCLPLGLSLAPSGQLIAAIANHSSQKNFLAISLFLPMCLPTLIAAAGRVSAILAGLDTLRYDALLVATALISLGAGNLLFAYLFEE